MLTQAQLDDWGDVKRDVHHQSLFYIFKIIRIKLIRHFSIEKLSKTHYQEILAIATVNWKDTSHDLDMIAYAYKLKRHKL